MKVTVGGKTYTPEVKDTPEGVKETFKGIKAEDLPKDYSKLLIFESEGNHPIWMKETPIPLKILWLDKTGQIKVVKNGVPNDETNLFPYDGDIKMVLELHAETAPDVQPGEFVKMVEKKQKGGLIITTKQEEYSLPSAAREYAEKQGEIENTSKDGSHYIVKLKDGSEITFDSAGKVVSAEVEEKYIFDYLGRVDHVGGESYTLNGYKLENEQLVEDKESSVEGELHEVNEANEDLAETQVGKLIWSYGVTKRMQEGGSVEQGMQILNEKGNPQMDLEGGERIISIKETKKLISLAKKAESDEGYEKLADFMVEVINGQDTREPEYTS